MPPKPNYGYIIQFHYKRIACVVMKLKTYTISFLFFFLHTKVAIQYVSINEHCDIFSGVYLSYCTYFTFAWSAALNPGAEEWREDKKRSQ